MYEVKIPAGTNLELVDIWCAEHCEHAYHVPAWPRSLCVPQWAVVEISFVHLDDFVQFKLVWTL
jgi:hypothetical protein